MEVQPVSLAQGDIEVPLTRPSPTPIPPAPGATPASAAKESVRVEAVLQSPVTADLPVGGPKESPKGGGSSGSPEAALDVDRKISTDPEVAPSPSIGDNMAAVRPGVQPFPVNRKTLCQPYLRDTTTTSHTAVTGNEFMATPPSGGPIASSVGIAKSSVTGGVTTKSISPPLRVVSPNSVPVKKRSAFRAETEHFNADHCIQGEGGSKIVGKVCENISPKSNLGLSTLAKGTEKDDNQLADLRERHEEGACNLTSKSNRLGVDDTNSAKRIKLDQDTSPPTVARSANGGNQPIHDTGTVTDIHVDGKGKRTAHSPPAQLAGLPAGKQGSEVSDKQSPESAAFSVKTSLPEVTNQSKQISTLKSVETTAGKSSSTSTSSLEDSSRHIPGSRGYSGTVPSTTKSCYPPLLLPSSCQVTLCRESNRAPKDGSKVHATTFVPDLGEFIPGPASSTREPLMRVGRNGQSGPDNQTSVKATEGSKGNVQNSSKNFGPKECRKGTTRHAGHVDMVSPKVAKREGKRSPSGDRTFSKMTSPGGSSGGSKMMEVTAKMERRGEGYSAMDGARKMRDIPSYGMKSPTGMMKTGDLSVITHPLGYQPLLSIGGSPPGQKSSSLSPRDRKPGDLRGMGDVRGGDVRGGMGDLRGGEMTEKQRQLLEWHLAAASQHGIFYEPTSLWNSNAAGFGTARTSMITSHSSTISSQESVLRSALLQGGAHNKHGTSSHTTSAMTSPKMTTATPDGPVSKTEPLGIPKLLKREEPKKTPLSKVNFGELGSGRGTPNSRSSEGTRNPPVGIALVQQRQETERKTDSRGSSSGSQRDRSDDRRHASRGTFSPHRDSRSTDSHREHRSNSNPSQHSRMSPHTANLAVTGGSSSHAPDFLAHHGPFPPFPSCYSRFPAAGGHNHSQPLWLPQPYALPTAHGSSPLTSSYQDVPLPGNIGTRDGGPPRPLMMFPPHLSATDGALHGLGTWPPSYLLPAPLHPQLGSLNPSLYAAQFAHLPTGTPGMGPLLPGQTSSSASGDVHVLIQQQQEALLHWYRAAELHRQSAFPAMADTTHPAAHHAADRSRKQSGGRKSVEGKSEHDKKQLKSETQTQESCGRTSRDAVEEKAAHPTPPSIIPPFIPVPSHGHMPLFYPSHTIPYLLDPTKRHIVPSHTPSTTAKVEKKDAGTSSHSPASRPASRDRPKPQEAETKSSDGTLKTACVQTLPPDGINEKETESEKGTVEKTEDVAEESDEKLESETLIVEDAEDKDLRLEKASKAKEAREAEIEKECSKTEISEKETENETKEQSDKSEKAPPVAEEKTDEQTECKPEETDQAEHENISEKTTDTIQSTDSESWLPNYPSCLEGQRRESLITSVMSTTQSVASKIEAVDHEQLAAIEGIALLSEAAEQITFEAICNRQDDDPKVSESTAVVETPETEMATDDLDKDIPAVQPPLSVSIDTEKMKINQLVELQRKYKEKKKELDKLQRKKDKKEKSEMVGEQTKKRGPGRPRKRKNSQRGKKTNDDQEKGSDHTNTLQSSADVLLEAAASLEEEETTPPPTKKKKKEKKKSKVKKDVSDVSKGEMSTSSIQSSADVLLEAAASLEQPLLLPIKKRKKEKKDKKMKYKKESLTSSIKDLKKKKKKLSKRKEEDLLANGGKMKKKNKHSLSEIGWSDSTTDGPELPVTGRKKLGTKNSEKKKRSSKVKSSGLPAAPEAIDLPAPEGASLPMYTEAKNKSGKNGLSISHVYGDSSDSDDEDSSQCSFAPVPKGLALLASTAELSSGHSTPVKRPKKPLSKKKLKSDDQGTKKRALNETAAVTASAAKKLKLSKKKEKLRLQKKRGRKPKKHPQKSQRADNANSTPPKFDAEMWSRRRSERIFLSDTSPQQSREVSPLEAQRAKMKLSLPSPSKTKVEPPLLSPIIDTVLDALKTDPFQMRQKFSQMSESDEDSGDSDLEPRENKLTIRRKSSSKEKLSQLMNEVDINSDSSNSDAEDMPLSSLVDNEPAPRICNLRVDDLVEGQRALVPFDNLFYEGKIHPIRPPDVYGVVFESRRGNRPHVYSQEQILQDVIMDVKPNSVKYLPEGTRICAYWSQQFNCLYPGTVVKGSPSSSGDRKMVTVEFDDGDSGRIPLSHVRMLPQDYPLISDLGSSSIPLERKLRQRNTETSCNLDEMKEDGRKRGIGKGKARKNKQLSEEGDDEVFLPNTAVTPIKKPRGRKPKVKTKVNSEPKVFPTAVIPSGPVKKGRGRPRKIRPEENQPPRKGRPRKKPLSGSVTLAKKINKFYAGRKKAGQQAKLTKPGARPRGRPPGSKKKVKGQPKLSPDILDPARAAMMRYTGPDDSEDAGTLGESDICSQVDEEEVQTKKRKGSKSNKAIVFIPERQLWRWLGNATQRKGSKGKAKKVFYKAIVRGKEVIRVNECAVFLSTGRPHLPYVGRIESMWESWGGIMVVRVKWFYHPEETKGCAANIEGKMALYQSSHVDENDIQTISHKCEVLSREEYKLRAMGKIPKNSVIDNEDVYYLAGTYDPTTGRMATFQ